MEGDHGGDLPLPRQFNLFVNYPGNYIHDGTIPFDGFRQQKENLARTIAKSDYPMKGKLMHLLPGLLSSKSFFQLTHGVLDFLTK
jgi:hypothetical protein